MSSFYFTSSFQSTRVAFSIIIWKLKFPNKRSIWIIQIQICWIILRIKFIIRFYRNLDFSIRIYTNIKFRVVILTHFNDITYVSISTSDTFVFLPSIFGKSNALSINLFTAFIVCVFSSSLDDSSFAASIICWILLISSSFFNFLSWYFSFE